MTREHAKELLPIIQAFANGEDIQINEGDNSNPQWVDIVNPAFMGCSSSYRIKPKPREFWVCIEDGTAWDHEKQAKEMCKPFHSTPVRVREILD